MTDTERDIVKRLRARVAELESSRFDVVTERNRFQTDNARLREALELAAPIIEDTLRDESDGSGFGDHPIVVAVRAALSGSPAPVEGWRDIESAPKGGGADSADSPDWVEPPRILLLFEDGEQAVCKWDWYYAPGGSEHAPDVLAWVEPVSGQQVQYEYGPPTHWMPLPPPPTKTEGE